MAEQKPKPTVENRDSDEEFRIDVSKLKIPFVSMDDIASGAEDKRELLQALCDKGQPVPRDWLCDTLSIQDSSLSSLVSRYKFSSKAYKSKDGQRLVLIKPRAKTKAK